MNKLDLDYQELLRDILNNGVKKNDRTGTGTISIFGRTIRHDMKTGFPLLTTKRLYFRGVVTELLWFLRGETNIRYLVWNGCHIWDGDAYKRYSKIAGMSTQVESLSKEEFINRIKNDHEFAKKWGELGPIYGKQWRDWNGITKKSINETKLLSTSFTQIDQIQNLINDLKNNPDSRRLMVNAWNVAEIDSMVLPPCHYGFQVYTRELSSDERYNLCAAQKSKMTAISDEDYIKYNIPTRAISLMFNMRSNDVPLGLPFNIASYGLLLEIFGKMVNMVPDELIVNLGDAHIYNNQVDGIKEQLKREPYALPALIISDEIDFNGTIDDFLDSCSISDFKIEGYQSHPSIKIPLSN